MNNGMNFLVALKKWHTALLYSDRNAFRHEKEIDHSFRGLVFFCRLHSPLSPPVQAPFT